MSAVSSPKPRAGFTTRRGPLALALAAAAALGACASQPRLPPPPTPASSASLASGESFTAPRADWPADGWWRAYGDAQLGQLIETALAGAPDMATAKARLAKAMATADTARADLMPSLSASGFVGQSEESLNSLGFPPQFQQYLPKGYKGYGQGALNFSYEIDFWGKNRSAVAAATSDARAVAADAAEARLTLSTAVAASYADLARLYAERDVTERSVASRQETLDLASRRVTNGLDTQAELKQAAAGVPAARADLAAIDEQIALTRNQLAALIGQGPDAGLAIGRPPAAALKPFGLPDRLAADLIGRRPDLVAARWRAEAASKRIGVAKAAFYPNINLTALAGYESLGLSKLFTTNSEYGQYGAAISLPIFQGGRLAANLHGARADYDEAVASYDATLIQALREVADAAASERALDERLTQSREALADDEAAYKVARLRYEGGLANYQSVLLAEDAVLAARRNVVDLEARAFTLDIQLIKALGGGFTSA
ncbi:MAG: efflux transporter outer membrane subunit [Caulobacteraceae bacterium]|nr:efflux transporter outer membrane subunit [Caulobacteraceae bacterium]